MLKTRNSKDMNIKQINQSKPIIISIYILASFVLLFTIASFGQFYSMKLNFKNPLIPEYLVEQATMPYLKKGTILLSGLVLTIISKYYKKNLLSLLIVILLIIYYISFNHSIGNWNTNI